MTISKIRLTMLCLSGFELYCRWVPLLFNGLEWTCLKDSKFLLQERIKC